MESIISTAIKFKDHLTFLWYLFTTIITCKPLYIQEIVIAGASLAAAMRIRMRRKDKEEELYWLHSLLLVIFNGFSGGMVVPALVKSNYNQNIMFKL